MDIEVFVRSLLFAGNDQQTNYNLQFEEEGSLEEKNLLYHHLSQREEVPTFYLFMKPLCWQELMCASLSSSNEPQ
jgi:hypothetical protein